MKRELELVLFFLRVAWESWRDAREDSYTLTPRAWRELAERDRKRWN